MNMRFKVANWFAALQTRLLLSYFALLLVMFGVLASAFFVLLITQPAPTFPTYQRLNSVLESMTAPSALRRNGWLRDMLRGDYTTLDEIASERGTRALLVDMDSARVIHDSTANFAASASVRLGPPEQFTPPAVDGGGAGGGPPSRRVFGSFTDSDGNVWLYVGAQTQVRLFDNAALLIAERRPTQTLRQALDEFGFAVVRPLVQAALVGIVAAFVLAWFISRSIARPLQQVAASVTQMGAGNLDHDLPLTGPTEVRAVADRLNRMSAALQQAQHSQRDFLANVSHDLKTPLTSIQGFSQAIMDGAVKDPAHAAAIIHDEAARLNRMVTELTDLARLQAGRLSMRSKPIDVGAVLAAVCQRLAVVAQQKGIALHSETPSMPVVAGDGDRLAQVFTNLVSNAIKYTPNGGWVRAEARVAANGVQIIVQDSGVGIPQADLPRVFERFYQVDKVRGPERGTGLGLAITHEIVTAHGGRITVASDGPNQGSTFTVWLPSPQLTTIIRKR
jgi:signal transduction histidine kinase